MTIMKILHEMEHIVHDNIEAKHDRQFHSPESASQHKRLSRKSTSPLLQVFKPMSRNDLDRNVIESRDEFTVKKPAFFATSPTGERHNFRSTVTLKREMEYAR